MFVHTAGVCVDVCVCVCTGHVWMRVPARNGWVCCPCVRKCERCCYVSVGVSLCGNVVAYGLTAGIYVHACGRTQCVRVLQFLRVRVCTQGLFVWSR